MELTGAYLKIGDVQGLPYRANLGQTAGASVSYRKALRIVAAVAKREPENLAARELLADAHDRAGFIEQRLLHWAVAMEEHEAARAIRESLPKSVKRDIALAQTWTAIGDCRYVGAPYHPKPRMRGTAQQAYESALAVLAQLPPTASLQREILRELGRAHQRLGGFYSGGGAWRNPELAVRHHDAALRALAQRAALDPTDAVARRNYADQFIMKATAQNMMQDGVGALASTTRGLAMFQELADADPKNVEGQHDLAFAWGEHGIALRNLGRPAEARAAFDKAIAIREKLIADDPSNEEEKRDLRRIERMREELNRFGVR
jgi:tetratricopeptide (TPR) repeat protein